MSSNKESYKRVGVSRQIDVNGTVRPVSDELVRVLLVEDNFCDSDVFVYGVKHHGVNFPIDVARDAEEALAMIAAKTYDIIVLDRILPRGFYGCEIAERLIADPVTRDIPRIGIGSGFEERHFSLFHAIHQKNGSNYMQGVVRSLRELGGNNISE